MPASLRASRRRGAGPETRVTSVSFTPSAARRSALDRAHRRDIEGALGRVPSFDTSCSSSNRPSSTSASPHAGSATSGSTHLSGASCCSSLVPSGCSSLARRRSAALASMADLCGSQDPRQCDDRRWRADRRECSCSARCAAISHRGRSPRTQSATEVPTRDTGRPRTKPRRRSGVTMRRAGSWAPD